MIKVSVLYPNKSGSRFDMDYYVKHHMPLAARLLGPAFQGDCRFCFDGIEAFLALWKPVMAEVTADIPKYTDVEPLIQFNEVRLSA